MGWKRFFKKRLFGIIDRRIVEVVSVDQQTVEELRQLVINQSVQIAIYERSLEEVVSKLDIRISLLEKN
jgi:ribosomal protein L31E